MCAVAVIVQPGQAITDTILRHSSRLMPPHLHSSFRWEHRWTRPCYRPSCRASVKVWKRGRFSVLTS